MKAATKSELRKVAEDLVRPILRELRQEVEQVRGSNVELATQILRDRKTMTAFVEKQQASEARLLGEIRKLHEHIASLENKL